jgi:hypothetical protein
MTDRTTTHDPTKGRDYSSTAAGSGSGGELFGETEKERARQAAEEIKSAAKDAAASTATALRNRLSGELDYRKFRSRQRLNRVADALRQANVDQQDETISRYMERAAQKVESMASYLDEKDVDEILRDAREMARRRPEIFVGGLFIAGLMLGRFLRSSASNENDDYDESWEDLPAYAGGGTSGSYGSTHVPLPGGAGSAYSHSDLSSPVGPETIP